MKVSRYFRQQGNILLISFGLLLGVAGLAVIALNITSGTARISDRSRDLAQAEAAAEGALEYAYGVWLTRIAGSPVTTAQASAGLVAPEFEGIEYGEPAIEIVALDAYGHPMSGDDEVPPAVTGRVPGYEGWSGRTFSYAARARVRLEGGRVIGVQRLFQYTEVPLFQSMFFFQSDLELYRPAPMVINGLVHSNGDMYFASDSTSVITVGSNVTRVGAYYEKEPPSAKHAKAIYVKDTTAGPTWVHSKTTQLHQVPAIQPMGGDPERVFNATDTNPNNDGFRELIETPVAGKDDPDAIRTRRMVNKAGIVISVNGDTVTVTGQRDTTLPQSAIDTIRGGITKTISREAYTRTVKGKKETVPLEGLYDAREKKAVDVVEIDMTQIVEALDKGGVSGAFANVIYLQDTTANTADNKNPKTFRLRNGHTLPANGLTIASLNPVYVQGDYNTGGTGSNVPTNKTGNQHKPNEPTINTYERRSSAIIADAVMFLSNSWNDAKSDQTNINERVASNTTYNTAILSGFKKSDDTSYSGGANNFPRFLENWSGKRCTYFGSMVELFESEIFTGNWNTTNIYNPPDRWWSFDTMFLQKPPPGSVEAIVLSRGPWSRF